MKVPLGDSRPSLHELFSTQQRARQRTARACKHAARACQRLTTASLQLFYEYAALLATSHSAARQKKALHTCRCNDTYGERVCRIVCGHCHCGVCAARRLFACKRRRRGVGARSKLLVEHEEAVAVVLDKAQVVDDGLCVLLFLHLFVNKPLQHAL